MPLWYLIPERADELDKSLYNLVPKLYHFAGKGLLRNTNLMMEEETMGTYRCKGHCKGSVMRKMGRTTVPRITTTGENSKDEHKTWVKGTARLRSGGSCEKNPIKMKIQREDNVQRTAAGSNTAAAKRRRRWLLR